MYNQLEQQSAKISHSLGCKWRVRMPGLYHPTWFRGLYLYPHGTTLAMLDGARSCTTKAIKHSTPTHPARNSAGHHYGIVQLYGVPLRNGFPWKPMAMEWRLKVPWLPSSLAPASGRGRLRRQARVPHPFSGFLGEPGQPRPLQKHGRDCHTILC